MFNISAVCQQDPYIECLDLLTLIFLSFTVVPVVNIIAPPEQTYKSQHVLTCSVSVPPKLFSHIIPYTTIVWSRQYRRLMTETEVQETYTDGFFLKRNLTFFSLNESDNGVYKCKVFIQFQDNHRPIHRQAYYRIRVRGIVEI